MSDRGNGERSEAARAARIGDAALQALLAVADQGSYTRAAAKLGLTQSAVSHAVASLETRLGVALLERRDDGVHLTPLGERVAAHAREIVRLKLALVREADLARRARRGRVRVASFGPTASRRLLPPLLDAFGRRYPDVEVTVVEGTDDEAAQWLRAAEVDVAFVKLPDDEFETVCVAEDALTVVLPAGHPLVTGARVAPDGLAGEPFILSSGGCERLVLSAVGDTPLDVRYEIRETDTVVAMVARRAGVAVVPRLALPDLAPAGVAFVPLDTDQVRRVGMAVRRSAGAGSMARAFLALARRADTAARTSI